MKISVVIPCRNAEPYLAQTIGSVLDQTCPAHEIIVIDDGSTDGSLALARRFEERCEGMVQVFAEAFGHASRSRNVGALLATGEALMFLDADDVLAPDTLEALGEALSAHPGAVAACPWRRLVLADGRWLSRPATCTPRRPGQDTLSAWLRGWYYPPCAILWSRDAFLRTGGWHEGTAANQDGDIIMRALLWGVPFIETKEGTAYYRRLPNGQLSVSGKRASYEGVASRLAVIRRIATLLDEQEKLDGYREALCEALKPVTADAAAYPELHREARSLERHCGPALWNAAISRYRNAWGRLAGVPAGRKPTAALPRDRIEEIRFGCERAEKILGRPSAAAPAALESKQARVAFPAVSVIIPTYNRPALLQRAIESVLGQTFADFEILVVDDGPTAETEAVVARLADARLRYLPQPKNAGVAAARNRGMREARAEFIAFLDDDDEWLPEKLAAQVALFRKLPGNVALLYTGAETIFGDGSRTTHLASARGDLYRLLLVRNMLHGAPSNAMMRRQSVAEVGFFDEHLPAIEDYDYWLRLSRRYQFECISRPLSRYYDNRAPATAESEARRSRNRAANFAARAELYRKHGRQMRKAGVAHLFLLDSAHRHLAPPTSDVRGARRLVAQALIEAPTSLAVARTATRLFAPLGSRTPRRPGPQAVQAMGETVRRH